jgi:hypothetical protein
MKTKTIVVVLMLILHFNLNASNQGMGNLYKYAIEDCYNEFFKDGHSSMQDTMYLIWCLHDCAENCIEYNIQLKNDQIQFKMPKVNESHPAISIYRLTIPELDGQYISISIVPYSVTYNRESRDLNFVRASTIIYRFKYDKKKSKYVFKLKKEYGL